MKPSPGCRFLPSSACASFSPRCCCWPFCRGFRVEKRQWPQILISGLWFALNLCLWIYAVSTTPSLGEGAFIMSLSMLFVPLTAWVMMKTRPARAYWECLPLAIVRSCPAEPAYADCLPPQPGLVSAYRAGAVNLVLLHQPLRPRGAADPADRRAARDHRPGGAGNLGGGGKLGSAVYPADVRLAARQYRYRYQPAASACR
ncbi:Uncharacterised protein [Raoultella terrigena]|uniref:Uncharacterized protein n=1 Tax=Raoultella terrigena TaxID=577 RepID=A0A4U9D9S3_RAOTE|nr:Uncharacterised protein [Raoultella terrigena]